MNIAQALHIKVALKSAMCPRVLTIQSVDPVTINTQDGPIEAHQLAGTDPEGTTYTVNLNQVTARQLITLTASAETDQWLGKRVMVDTTVKGDRTFFAFVAAPVHSGPVPQRLPATDKHLPAPLTPEPDAITHKRPRLTKQQLAETAQLAALKVN